MKQPKKNGHDPAAALPVPVPVGFDEELYLKLNPEVDAAVQKGEIASGVAHWMLCGRDEERAGRRPSILHEQHYRVMPDHKSTPPSADEIAAFDAQAYLEANVDVRVAIGSNPADALEHWINHGRFEGRVSSNRKLYTNRPKP